MRKLVKETRIYEEQGIYVQHRILHTERAGTIEDYVVARESNPTSWIGPFYSYERARDFLIPARSIYLAHEGRAG